MDIHSLKTRLAILRIRTSAILLFQDIFKSLMAARLEGVHCIRKKLMQITVRWGHYTLGVAYGGVGVGVETRGEPTPGVVPVGVFRGRRTFFFF